MDTNPSNELELDISALPIQGKDKTSLSVSKAENPIPQLANLQLAPLTTFTIFHRLPAEIRLKIWKEAAHAPRVVPVVDDIHADRYFVPPQPRSSLFSVCTEAHDTVKKIHLAAYFGWPGDNSTYVNSDSDIIWPLNEEIHSQSYPRLLLRLSKRQRNENIQPEIKYLALSESIGRCLLYENDFFGLINEKHLAINLEKLCNQGVQELFIVMGREKHAGDPDLTFVYPPWEKSAHYVFYVYKVRSMPDLLPGGRWYRDQGIRQRVGRKTWAKREECAQESLENFRQNILREQRLWVAGGNYAVPPGFKTLHDSFAPHCADRKIPRIRFVEATTPAVANRKGLGHRKLWSSGGF